MDPIAALRRASSDLMPQGSSILLAVSGGADSTALLHAAAQMAPETGWTLSVAHVHHGWRGREADRDVAFVHEHARRLRLPFLERRRDARREARDSKLSPEAAARSVRYDALAEMRLEAGASLVATAHQRDDRVESYLLGLERRAGLATLAGPRIRRVDGVVRPFLDVRRREILDFLARRGIAFRRDSTNGNLTLPRNRIRRELAVLEHRGGGGSIEILAAEVERLDRERERIDREFDARVRPRLSLAPGSVVVDADFLQDCSAPLLRRALEEAARPFAAPGRPPLTGPEREQISQRLSAGENFRFEAGRRIRFERRGRVLTISPRGEPTAGRGRAAGGAPGPNRITIQSASN